ncbi:MAG: hypothetical protein F7C34_05510 [Desulfurococcales archaeon]|nr:hypothetical protein [Desulfurococcales archaeon]
MRLRTWSSYSSLTLGIALLLASLALGANPSFSPAPGLGGLLVLAGLLGLATSRYEPLVEAVAGSLAGIAALLAPPSQGPGVVPAVLGASAAALVMLSRLLGRRLRAVTVGVLVPLLVFLGLPMYPEWSGASMILLAVAGPLLAAWDSATAGLVIAAYSGVYDPVPALAAVTGGAVALLARGKQELLGGVPALLLAVSAPVLHYYQPAGPVLVATGGLAAVWLLGERRPEILAAAVSPGVVLYFGGLYGGLSRGAASGLFMAGALVGLSLLLVSKGRRTLQAVIASGLLILALSASLFVPATSGGASVEVASYAYDVSEDGFNPPPYNASTGQSWPGEIGGLEGASRIAALLLLDPAMPAQVVAPGIVDNVTIRDLSANTTVRIDPEGPSFILMPLNSSLTALYAADPEGPLLRAALRVPWIVIPLQLTGGTLPSPVHTIITVNYSDPMIVRLPGGGRLEVRTAVIASSFVAGGPRSEAEELPIGARWTNVAVGVARGSVEYRLGGITIPYNITSKHLEIFDSILAERKTDKQGAALKGLEALYELALRDKSSPAPAPVEIKIKAGTSQGTASLTLLHAGDGYTLVYEPLTTLNGTDTVAIIPRPGTLGVAGYNSSYACALAAAYTYDRGGGIGSVLASSRAVGCEDPASAAWLGAHAVSPRLASPPPPTLEAYTRPFGALALIAPFLAGIGAAIETSVSRGRLAEAPELALGAEPELS